jgi:anti-anti-sigma factor
MEVTAEISGEATKLKVKGRLDGYWADHLAKALEEEIHRGSHRLLLDLSEVIFLSSAGIRVLVKYYKQLREIEGSLMISEASQQVTKVLEISKLAPILLAGENAEAAPGENTATAAALPGNHLEIHGAAIDMFSCVPDAKLKCRLFGDPNLLPGCRFHAEDCRTVQFPESMFGLGLGALGDSFEECRGRFGEFLASGGAVAYFPTDGTNVPDYLLAAAKSLPEVQVCYGVACQGEFAKLARFEARNQAGAVTLAQLAEAALEIAGSEQVGLLMVAESAGLIGAALRRPPSMEAGGNAPFEFPQVREWLSFTAEPAYTHSLVLVAGVAALGDAGLLAPILRPLRTGSSVMGHFHAATFSYRPMQKGDIDLNKTVRSLFEDQILQGVLHLLSDDRAIAGAGQSQFVRGACWLAPLAETIEERR